MSNFGSTDFYLEVTKGNVPGHAIIQAFGERLSMGTTVTGEDIWRGNELTPAPTSTIEIPIPDPAGEQMSVVSESADDTILGSGVQSVRIFYCEVGGIENDVDIEMDGTNPVNLPADIMFIQDMCSAAVGANGVAEDHIKIHNTADVGLVYSMIAQGGNRALMSNRMTPADKTVFLKGWHASEAQGRRVNMRIRSTDARGIILPGVFCFKDVTYLKQTTSGELPLNIVVPELSNFKVTGWPVQAGAEVSCSLWGVMVDNDLLSA